MRGGAAGGPVAAAEAATCWAGGDGTTQPLPPCTRAAGCVTCTAASAALLRNSGWPSGRSSGRLRCESRHECCQAVRALTRCRSRVLACVRQACMRASCGRGGGRVCLRACCSCMRVSAWCQGARWIVTSRMVVFFLLKKRQVLSHSTQLGLDSGGFHLLVAWNSNN